RLLVAKVETASGAGDGAAQRIVARGSMVELSRVDPWVNLLRATTQTLSGALGGADAVIVHPVDRRLGDGDAHARRVALNVQNVLRDEGHLARVADPAGGSWAIERLTDDLARTAWDAFRSIEADGGLAAVLGAGTLQATIAQARAARIRDLDRRRETIVGVSVFPNLTEERPAPPRIDAEHAEATAPTDGDATAEPLPRFYAADRFEALRLSVDDIAAEQGGRPRVALVNLGQPRDFRARNEFAAGFFSVAGFETIDVELADGRATLDGVEIACLCSSDALYPEHVPDAVDTLRDAGARWVLLAGRPADHEQAWREAGVDDFIYVGSDVHGQLAALVELAGIVVESTAGEAS
ncbi:MAG: methylmalonyl-CoA mutase family protein, partial [Acidobacteriota bacterium]